MYQRRLAARNKFGDTVVAGDGDSVSAFEKRLHDVVAESQRGIW
jgi:hypothetical protein